MTIRPQIYSAQRLNVKASIQIEGLTGTGKTGLALLLAYSLAGKDWGATGMVDSENRSSNLYEGALMSTGIKVEPFLKVDLLEDDGYSPVNYLACMDALRVAGCKAVIADSATHAWQRTGGVLDMVNTVEQKTRNKYTAWGDPEVVKNKNALFEMLRSDKVHVITTVRIKEKFGMEMDPVTNKNKVVSLGEQQQTQDGIKYEPDLVLHMVSPGSKEKAPVVRIIKSRYPMFDKEEEYEFTEEVIDSIREYLEEGADPDVLVQKQKDEYVKAIIEYCKVSPARKGIYDQLKRNHGHEETKLQDMPVSVIKTIYIELTN